MTQKIQSMNAVLCLNDVSKAGWSPSQTMFITSALALNSRYWCLVQISKQELFC